MLFNSYIFLIFICIVYSAYNSMSGWTNRKVLLLGASYFFYAWWNPPFVLLLILSTIVDFFAAKKMFEEQNKYIRQLWLWISLSINLGVLGFFKYGNFFAENFARLTNMIGLNWHYVHDPWNIVLPLGISFYTFQTLSYTLDVYKGRLKPTSNILDFALYVSFFPQLVAGPIIRATDYLWQCEKKPVITSSLVAYGISLFAWGLFKKSVIADNVAVVVNEIFSAPGKAGILDSWIATYGFAIQIYCDFSGYSDMAIGLALTLGFHFPNNFNRPYGALGFSDFWQRWHISLSSWLKDYLYFSLGGNRKGTLKTYLNLMLTMLLGGLWHGANWTFVVWGGLHGIYLAIERYIFNIFGLKRDSAEHLPFILQVFVGIMVFHLICFAWIFFRAQTISEGFNMGLNMIFLGNDFLFAPGRAVRKTAIVLFTCLLVGWHIFNRNVKYETLLEKMPEWMLGPVTASIFILCWLIGGGQNDFIYFQF